jgi:uncharacterized circularly permuted ATP-grasp superfamily protein
VETYRLDNPEVREYVLERLDRLVVKPVDGSGGSGILIGSQATAEQLEAAAKRIVLDPRGWIAQREVRLSTVPTLVGDRLRPRHVDLRPFAVNDGSQIRVLPGGLTRVALPEGALVVNSSQGGGSKDTWVVNDSLYPVSPAPAQPGPPGIENGERVEHEVVPQPDPGPGVGAFAGQQQQQQQTREEPC